MEISLKCGLKTLGQSRHNSLTIFDVVCKLWLFVIIFCRLSILAIKSHTNSYNFAFE